MHDRRAASIAGPALPARIECRGPFRRCAWLNPVRRAQWNAPSIRLIREIFPMYPLTVQGVEDLARDLSKA
jgi:uncharacterized protein with von Willebrand factor type A (vWA) domain